MLRYGVILSAPLHAAPLLAIRKREYRMLDFLVLVVGARSSSEDDLPQMFHLQQAGVGAFDTGCPTG